MKTQVTALALAVLTAAFLGSGCESTSSPAAAIDTARGDWEADIAKIKTTAIFYAKQVRTKIPDTDPARAVLEKKYTDAEVSVNLWIQDVQDSIRSGSKPTDSPIYKTRELAANESYSRFVVAAEEAVNLDTRPKWLPLAALAPGVVDFLWKRAVDAANKRAEEAKRVRAEYAARLEQYRLPSFTKAE